MDNELARLKDGLPITRDMKKKSILKDMHRRRCKDELIEGLCSPLEYLKEISHTVGSLSEINSLEYSDNSDEDDESTQEETKENSNSCVVCLRARETTWIFMPCRHASCYGDCRSKIIELGQTSPICRSPIQNSFEIFVN